MKRTEKWILSKSRTGKLVAEWNKEHSHLFDGAQSSKHKLTDKQVLAIRAAYPNNTIDEIAKKYKIDRSMVSLIVNRKRWKHI